MQDQLEMRLVAEWLAEFHSAHYYQTRVRLGSLPLGADVSSLDAGEAALVHSAFARWVDAIVALPDRTLLIEAKIVAHSDALGALLVYERLVPASHGLNVRPNMPVEKVHLFAKPDPVVAQLGMEMGVTMVQFEPAWIDEMLAKKAARQRSGVRPQQLAPAQ